MKPGIETPKLGALGEWMLQYKKCMIPAYERCLLPTIQRLAAGDYMIIGRIAAALTLGGLRDTLNRLAEGRELPTAREFIMHGISESDLLPFVGSLFKDMSEAFYSQGVLDHMGDNLAAFFKPPAIGTYGNLLRASSGMMNIFLGNERPTMQEVRAIKKSIVLNNTFYLRGVLRRWEEAMMEPRP
jgi:hypothetical protein